MIYEVKTLVSDGGAIHQSVTANGYLWGGRQVIINQVVDTMNAQARDALIKLGWRPPVDLGRIMVVCPQCGNKRCPKATDNNAMCSNSNDSAQPCPDDLQPDGPVCPRCGGRRGPSGVGGGSWVHY